MKKNYFKIKVGIEEFEVNEEDIPRIAEAMKTSNMVQLECGLFRGSAILAVCHDEKRESMAFGMEITERTPEQIAEINRRNEIDEIIKKQIASCSICNGNGWTTIKRNGEFVATNCECTILQDHKQPEIKKITDTLSNKFKI